MPALHQIRLGVSPITDQVYMGTVSKANPNVWLQKRECVSDFCSALFAWVPPGTVREIRDSDGNLYEITVKSMPKV